MYRTPRILSVPVLAFVLLGTVALRAQAPEAKVRAEKPGLALLTRFRPDFYRARLRIPKAPVLHAVVPLEIEADPLDDVQGVRIAVLLPDGIALWSPGGRATLDLVPGRNVVHTVLLEVLRPGRFRIDVNFSNPQLSGADRSYFLFIESSVTEGQTSEVPFAPEPYPLNQRSVPITPFEFHTLQTFAPVAAQYECGTGNVYLTGSQTYTDDGGNKRPVRNATLQVYEPHWYGDAQLIACQTDASGNFGVRLSFTGTKSMYVKVLAESPAAVVQQCGLLGCSTYYGAFPQDSSYNLAPKTVDASNSATWNFGSWNMNDAPSFKAMDWVQDEYQWISDQTGGSYRSPVTVEYPSSQCSVPDCSQWPCSSGDRIYLPDKASCGPWDRLTVLHEYAHSAMYASYGNRLPGGCTLSSHTLYSNSCEGFAITEGWAEFMEGAVDNSPAALPGCYASGCSLSPNNLGL